MALARVNMDGVTLAASGTLELLQLGLWHRTVSNPPLPSYESFANLPWYGGLLGVGGAVQGSCRLDNVVDDANHTSGYLYVVSYADAGVVPDSDDDTLVGEFHRTISPPSVEWDTYVDDVDLEAESSAGELWPYKERGFCIPSEDVINPTHPNHGWVAYAWGSADAGADPYTRRASIGDALDQETDALLPPEFDVGTDGWPVAGSGTMDLSPTVVTLGCSSRPTGSVTGIVARWDELALGWTGETVSPDLTGLEVERDGMRCYGDGSSLVLEVTDWTAIPATYGAGFALTIPWPTRALYDLAAFNWTSPMAAQFSIPDATGVAMEAVSGGQLARAWWGAITLE